MMVIYVGHIHSRIRTANGQNEAFTGYARTEQGGAACAFAGKGTRASRASRSGVRCDVLYIKSNYGCLMEAELRIPYV